MPLLRIKLKKGHFMTELELNNFLRELAYIPLLTNNIPALLLVKSFPETDTLIFLVTTDPWGENILLKTKTPEGFKKLTRYLEGLEPFLKTEESSLLISNKEASGILKIGETKVEVFIKPLYNFEKDLFLKGRQIGLNIDPVPLVQ